MTACTTFETLAPASAPLAKQIRAEIGQDGPISFARFMERALYDPVWGYYERRLPLGRRGDYTTSVSAGGLFGELLAFAFNDWAAGQGSGPLQIVEGGAHDGRLARDILAWFGAGWANPRAVEYWLVEPSVVRRAWQRETLGDWTRRVRWVNDWSDVPAGSVRGVIFANELLDALPVRRWGWDAALQAWFEWGVGVTAGRLVWVRLDRTPPDSGPGGAEDGAEGTRLRDFFPFDPGLLAVLPDGFTVETCAAAVAWWRQAAESLERGRLLTFDYGLPAEELLSPARSRGTVRAYREHRVTDAVLERPGDQDLTAHVNFSALQAAGESAGLKTERFESQSRFLMRVLAEIERRPTGFAPWTAARRRQLGTLVHPDHFGRAFRVLVQSRGVEA